MSLTGLMLGAALRDHRLEEDVTDGIKAMVTYYYDNYTDATEIDDEFLGLLRRVGDALCSAGTTIDAEYVEDAVREAEQEYADTPEPWRNGRTGFRTESLYRDDEDED